MLGQMPMFLPWLVDPKDPVLPTAWITLEMTESLEKLTAIKMKKIWEIVSNMVLASLATLLFTFPTRKRELLHLEHW